MPFAFRFTYFTFLDGKTYKTLWCNALFTKGFYKGKKKEDIRMI